VKLGFFSYWLVIVFSMKLWVFIYILNYTSLGGADAESYHLFALGLSDKGYNFWGDLLRFLYENGLYNREVLKYCLFVLSSIVSPIVLVMIMRLHDSKPTIKTIYFMALLIALYPTLFFFSIDVYRDVVMVFLFLVILYTFKKYLVSRGLKSFMWYSMALLLSVHLYEWRPYLGFSLVVALLGFKVLNLSTFSFRTIAFLYMLGLVLAFSLGYLDRLVAYREGFANISAGSTLGVGFIGKSPLEFLVLFIYSGFLQLFGLYIVNLSALFLFVVESIPFIWASIYIYVNRIFLGEFEKFILLFGLIYATIWIVGNDNLGTAIRLRMFNYIGVLIVAGYVYVSKKASLEGK
jgi:hypothetical protein